MKIQILSLAVLLSSLALAGSIITATNIVSKDNLQMTKAQAVQGCYEVTSGLKKTDLNDSSLDEVQINRETLEECLTLKGF